MKKIEKEKKEKKDDTVKDGIILQSEDHIKIVDKKTGIVILDKRG
jgi:hypothetical protein